MDTKNILNRNKIVEMYAGSHAYGTNLPSSDIDIRGIFVADPVSIRTPFFSINEITLPKGDIKFYELNKFIELAVKQNPNIVEMLWTAGQDIIFSTHSFELLRQHRTELLTKKIAHTTSGYAYSQLKRIKGHKKWISNPQSQQPPKIHDFVSVVYNFTSNSKWNKQVPFQGFFAVELGDNLYGLFRDQKTTWIDSQGNLIVKQFHDVEQTSNFLTKIFSKNNKNPDLIVKINRKHYQEAYENWKNYWEWKNNRNQTRADYEQHYGYDTKHAMHLVRLLRMGYEALTEGVIKVKRPDAQELLGIRNGNWTYEEIIQYAEHMNNQIEKAIKTSHLPNDVVFHKIAKLVIDIQNLTWHF